MLLPVTVVVCLNFCCVVSNRLLSFIHRFFSISFSSVSSVLIEFLAFTIARFFYNSVLHLFFFLNTLQRPWLQL